MEHGKGNFKIFTLQVGKQLFNIGRHDQTFVRHQGARKSGNVKVRILTPLMLHLFASQIDQCIKAMGCNQGGWDNEQLNNFREFLQGIFTQSVGIQWHDPGQQNTKIIFFAPFLKCLQLLFRVTEKQCGHCKLFG